MKKKIYYLFPFLAFVLMACEGFEFGFNEGQHHSAGLDKSFSASADGAPTSYYYYSGDTFDKEGYSSAIITFQNINENASNITDVDVLSGYLNVTNGEAFSSLGEPQYVGTKEEGILFIGSTLPKNDGALTFTFNVNIDAVVIEAKPYSYVDNSFNKDELIVDHNVAIAVNDKPYIKLGEEVDSENEDEIETTECVYALEEISNSVKIKVATARAVIEKIIVYYN
ncbi:MAG TPA: hypothetical protein GX010_00885 [Erysipelotrichaceae bacterium]|nr:hypothetical protein [Erysipelotrichaceae bacterium]